MYSTEVMNASSEFVGSKSLELDIYGLRVLKCKEISHPFTNIMNKFHSYIYEKTIKGIYPESRHF